jgi:hypothetical protein
MPLHLLLPHLVVKAVGNRPPRPASTGTATAAEPADPR